MSLSSPADYFIHMFQFWLLWWCNVVTEFLLNKNELLDKAENKRYFLEACGYINLNILYLKASRFKYKYFKDTFLGIETQFKFTTTVIS